MAHVFLFIYLISMAMSATAKGSPSQDIEDCIRITNEVRRSHGLRDLEPTALLVLAAQKHADYMAGCQCLCHNAGHKTLDDRLCEVGYTRKCYGENVARKTRSSAHAIKLWLNSPGHRRNILKAKYTHIGVGCAYCRDGKMYLSQVFGVPPKLTR